MLFSVEVQETLSTHYKVEADTPGRAKEKVLEGAYLDVIRRESLSVDEVMDAREIKTPIIKWRALVTYPVYVEVEAPTRREAEEKALWQAENVIERGSISPVIHEISIKEN